jgi:hypothetical protein
MAVTTLLELAGFTLSARGDRHRWRAGCRRHSGLAGRRSGRTPALPGGGPGSTQHPVLYCTACGLPLSQCLIGLVGYL